ncbi:MAG: hypothetical protein EON86_01615 [Brevundimonas sp.]|nr:MAG: hypothetical protein EON86_01615 [Brevundimonas sp.]
MIRAGAIVAVALLALAGCQRPAPPSDITGLLRAQGFRYLDEPDVTITPICSMRVGPTRYDFYWYKWQQRPERAPGATHAAHRLIQIRDGRTYEGHYGGMQPYDRPTCRPDSHELIFKADRILAETSEESPTPVIVRAGGPSQHIAVGEGGLPQRILVNGEAYTRDR